MHISEGVLATPVLAGGAVLAAAGLAVGLKRLRPEQAASSAMVAAIFFLASLVHVPLGPTNAHLTLNGLVGLVLGWGAVP
ncbi:MAG: energy-coupling factor ABC transporter permease, partial [Deltaproteobacteria bacterium]|nr:energy-coupling factor ABC transporter permease [Deltaproteobacteria bacterium]